MTRSDTSSGDSEETSQSSPSNSVVEEATNFVNDHLLAVRYGLGATISLLAAYGISQTPLFFRYRTVSDLPTTYFRNRRSLSCRLVRVESVGNVHDGHKLECHLRHLSPAERLLTASQSAWIMNWHPSVAVTGSRADERHSELLTIRIAGLQSSPEAVTWLQQLASERTKMTCQLLARVQLHHPTESTGGDRSRATGSSHSDNDRRDWSEKRKMAPKTSNLGSDTRNDDTSAIAVGKLFYRPRMQLFATDVGELLIRNGRASVAAEQGMYGLSSHERITETSDSVRDLQRDAAYMERLSRAEYDAAANYYGIWTDPAYREKRRDLVEEVEFQTRAPWWRKVSRWIRGG